MPAYVFHYGNLDGPWKVDFRDVHTLVLNRYGADLHRGCLRSLGITWANTIAISRWRS
jgi:hypothetical protein